jgi:hypothetical protein
MCRRRLIQMTDIPSGSYTACTTSSGSEMPGASGAIGGDRDLGLMVTLSRYPRGAVQPAWPVRNRHGRSQRGLFA